MSRRAHARAVMGVALSAAAVGGSLLGVAAWSPALAAPTFSLLGEPLDVRADQVEVDVEAASALLTGHVELTRKDLHVACPRVEARFDKDGRVLSAQATGRVTVVSAARGLRGEADEVRLDLRARTAELRGHVRVAQGGSSLEAERATVDLSTSRVSLQAVRGTLVAPAAASATPSVPSPSPSPAPSSAPTPAP